MRELRQTFFTCLAMLKRLAAQGLVAWEERRSLSHPFKGQPAGALEPSITLVPEQTNAVEAFVQGLRGKTGAPFLLHGVTASGKTEVYLAAAREALAQGRQVLTLLPEMPSPTQ